MTVREIIERADWLPPVIKWGVEQWLPDEIMNLPVVCKVDVENRRVSIRLGDEEALTIGFDEIEKSGEDG